MKTKQHNENPKSTRKFKFDKYTVAALLSLTAFAGFFIYLWIKPSDQIEVSQKPGKNIITPEERRQKNILMGPHIPPETKTLYNYSQRLEDANNLMWTLLVTLMHETMKTGRQPADLPSLIALAKTRAYKGTSMWMERWEVSPDQQAVRTEVGLNLIAYRASPLSLEIRNVPYEQGSQVLLMRVPETDGSPLFTNPDFAEPSRRVAGVLLLISPPNAAFYPPFTAKQSYLLSNWREEPIKLSTENSPEREAIINRWIDDASQPKNN